MKNLIFLWLLFEEAKAVINDCPPKCHCAGSKMACDEVMPDYIPDSIEEVIVYEGLLGALFNFSDLGWKNVRLLSVNTGLSVFHQRPETFRTLHKHEFVRLENLEVLQIACKCLGKIQEGAFYGLNKLKVLNLSNNPGLSIASVVQGLNGADTLPNLSGLYLSNTSVLDFEAFLIGKDFLEAVRNKRLKVLDISNTKNAWFEWDIALLTAFPVLEKLNVSAAGLVLASLMTSFASVDLHPSITSFTSLKILDISYPSVPYHVTDTVFGTNMPHESSHMHAPHRLNELYAKRILTSSGKIHATSNATHLCFWLVPRQRNHQFCYIGKSNNLKKLVFTENLLQYIEPNVWGSFQRLQYLDLSSNELGDAISDGSARSIADTLNNLKFLILSNNGIYNIPEDTFRGAQQLQVLDLSVNDLVAITFETDKLISLKKLDLSHNRITILDEVSLNRLSNLLSAENPSDKHKTVEITLKGNSFLCTCENIPFLNWLTSLNRTYTCTTDSEQLRINDSVIFRSELACKKKIIIAVFATLSVTVSVLIAIMFCLLMRERKKFMLHKKTQRGIELYSFCFKETPPVFLSFCSEDDQKVMDYILPNLEKGLKKILRTNYRCVATGYGDFRPGFSLANEIIRCVEASSVVVLFVTNTFCRKMWCRNEALTAYYENKPIILMMWETLDIKLMPKYLHKHYQEYASVHWVEEHGQRVMKPGWDELCESIVRLFSGSKSNNCSQEKSDAIS